MFEFVVVCCCKKGISFHRDTNTAVMGMGPLEMTIRHQGLLRGGRRGCGRRCRCVCDPVWEAEDEDEAVDDDEAGSISTPQHGSAQQIPKQPIWTV